jgi:hypothetical protein
MQAHANAVIIQYVNFVPKSYMSRLLAPALNMSGHLPSLPRQLSDSSCDFLEALLEPRPPPL